MWECWELKKNCQKHENTKNNKIQKSIKMPRTDKSGKNMRVCETTVATGHNLNWLWKLSLMKIDLTSF